MSSIILPGRFYSQPQGAVEVDWANPLVRGLVDVFNPLSLTNVTSILRYMPSVAAGTITPSAGQMGRSITLPAATLECGLIVANSADTLFPSSTDATIFVVRRSLDTTARQSSLFGYNGGNDNRVSVNGPWSDGNIYFDFGGIDASQRISTTFAKSTNVDYLVFVAGGGKGREIWRNKVKIAGDATKGGARPSSALNVRIGGVQSVNSDSDEIYLFGVANRAWSDAEIISWFDNPWQIFRAPKRVLYFPVGVAAGVPLEGAATATATATGALTVAVPLAGAGLAVATATGALSVSIRLAGAGTATATATGGLSLSIPLSGAAVAQAMAAAGLSQSVALGGDATAAASATGALTLNVSLSGAAIAAAAASAGLSVTGASELAGNAAAQAAASGALSLGVPLSGAALTVASADGSLTHIVPLAGSAASASLATGGLDVSVSLDADALVQAMATAGLTVEQGGLAGAAAAQASASGTVTLRVNLDGAAVAQAVAGANLDSYTEFAMADVYAMVDMADVTRVIVFTDTYATFTERAS